MSGRRTGSAILSVIWFCPSYTYLHSCFGLRVSVFGIRILGWEFRRSVDGLVLPHEGITVLDFGFGISGFGFTCWQSCGRETGFRVSDFRGS